MNTPAPQPDALVVEAQRHHTAGRLAEAEAAYTAALNRRPNNAEALHLLGALRVQQNDPAEAIKLLRRAIKLKPDVPEFHMNLGAALRKASDPSRAVFAFRNALALLPSLAAAQLNIAHVLREALQYDAAIKAYESYLEDAPNDIAALLGLAAAHLGADRFDTAMSLLDVIIATDPTFAEGYQTIACALRDRGYFNASIPFFQRAAELAADVADWVFEYGHEKLRLEQWREGWPLYENRFEREIKRVVRRPAPPPYWQGEALHDKALLVWMEQGLGEEILFASMLSEIMAQAGRCVIECSPRMVPVFSRSFRNANVIGNADLGRAAVASADVDFQIAAGSLCRYLRPDNASFPTAVGYLINDPERTAALRTKYNERANAKFIVGISWRSQADAGEAKSIPLAQFGPLLSFPNIQFVSLQYGASRKELEKAGKEFGVDIFHDTSVDPLTDMEAHVAQIAAMDLVITTSNTAAHVAGALGKETWVLLPNGHGLHWYWLCERANSLWYPSVRLFRPNVENRVQSWRDDVVASAAAALDDLVSSA